MVVPVSEEYMAPAHQAEADPFRGLDILAMLAVMVSLFSTTPKK